MSKLVSRRNIVRLALSRAELALAIGVSPPSVDQMVVEGMLPPPRRWHSRKLWIVSEVEAYLNDWPSDGDESKRQSPLVPTAGNYWDGIGKPDKGRGGYPIPDHPHDELAKYYDRLGFEPITMGQDEMTELVQKHHERWKASIPGTPMGKREIKALTQLELNGIGIPVFVDDIKGCGSETIERLLARGYVETRFHPKFKEQIDALVLTISGAEAIKAISK